MWPALSPAGCHSPEAWEPACRSSQRSPSWIECGPTGWGWLWVTDGGPAQGAIWAETQHSGSLDETDMAGLRWERPPVFGGPVGLQPCPLGGLRGLLPTSRGRPWGYRGCTYGSFLIRVGQSFPRIAVFFLVQGPGKHIAMKWPSGSFCEHWLYMVGKGTLGLELIQGSRKWGTHVYLWRIHFDIWQNQYNIVKLKNKIKRKCIITFRHMTLCYISFFLFSEG